MQVVIKIGAITRQKVSRRDDYRHNVGLINYLRILNKITVLSYRQEFHCHRRLCIYI